MKNFHIHRLLTKFRSTPISTTCFKTIKIKNMSQWFNGKKSKLYYKVGGQLYSIFSNDKNNLTGTNRSYSNRKL